MNLSISLPARISTKCHSWATALPGKAAVTLCVSNSLIPISPAALKSSFASRSLFFFASLLVSCNSTQSFVQLRLQNKVAGIDQNGYTLKENITKSTTRGAAALRSSSIAADSSATNPSPPTRSRTLTCLRKRPWVHFPDWQDETHVHLRTFLFDPSKV